MTNSLFPKNNGRILIEQGDIGDCYLLASLDCIFNSGPKGYEYIKSLFTEVPEGVIVRLRHNDQSTNLTTDLLAGKYEYSHDIVHNEDVFFLNRARLDEIDRAPEGAETNSLAVNILEHLSSYYFTCGTETLKRTTSLTAHDLPYRNYGTETIFVAKLLGLYAHDLYDFKDIIKIKTICPDQPIYIGMLYDFEDTFGTLDKRHALRIERIIPINDRPGDYMFVLVNPWDNQLTETYTLEELKKRKCRFSIFDTDRPKYELIRMLMSRSDTLGQIVFANPELLQMVLRIKRLLGSSFNEQDIEYCDMLCRQNVFIPEIFNHSNFYQQRALATDMHAVNGKVQNPLHEKLMHFFSRHTSFNQWSALRFIIFELANTNISMAIISINLFPISFVGIQSSKEIDAFRNTLIMLLHFQIENNPLLIAADCLLNTKGIARQHPLILKAFDEKTTAIHAMAEHHRSNIAKAHAAREHYGLFSIEDNVEENPSELQAVHQSMRN